MFEYSNFSQSRTHPYVRASVPLPPGFAKFKFRMEIYKYWWRMTCMVAHIVFFAMPYKWQDKFHVLATKWTIKFSTDRRVARLWIFTPFASHHPGMVEKAPHSRPDKWKTPRGRREMGCKRKRRCDVVVKLLVGPFYVLICSQLLRRSSHPEPRGLGRYSRRPRSDRREPGAEWAADPGRGEIQ